MSTFLPKLHGRLYEPKYLDKKKDVGLALGGGGSEIFTYLLGVMRVFADDVENSLYSVVSDLSSVSGSSWFASLFLFSTEVNSGKTMRDLLGYSLLPQEMTLKNLTTFNKNNSFWGGNVISRLFIIIFGIYQYLFEYQLIPQDAWIQGIAKGILFNYNLNNYILVNSVEDLERIRNENPFIPNDKFLVRNANIPDWICNGSVLNENNKWILFNMGFLKSGFLTQKNVDTFLFGTKNISTKKEKIVTSLNYVNSLFTLQSMIGISSSAYVKYFETIPVAKRLIKKAWVETDSGSQNFVKLGDGGFSDNSGVISLVKRGIKKIFCIYHYVSESFTERLNIVDDLVISTPIFLFGLSDQNNVLVKSPNTQIFATEDYRDISNQFQQNYQNGGPVYAQKRLYTIKNDLYEIGENQPVDLLILLSVYPQDYLDQTSKEVKEVFIQRQQNAFLKSVTEYANRFRILQLSNREINYLSSMGEWCMNDPRFKEVWNSFLYQNH